VGSSDFTPLSSRLAMTSPLIPGVRLVVQLPSADCVVRRKSMALSRAAVIF
jgi:hypothetical protein